MAYSLEEKETILTTIFDKIENGVSTRKAVIEAKISSKTFWEWIDGKDEDGNITDWSKEKVKQYTRACEARTEFMADEILEIADSTEADIYKDDDGNIKIDGNTVQRARTQIETRKWLMSKMFPKKYGDKVDMTTNGKDLPSAPSSIQVQIVTSDDDEN